MSKKKALEADSEAGETVALIDAVITICNIISNRDLFDDAGIIQEALNDLRDNDGMKRLMDIGDLQAASDYIKEQQKMIDALCNSFELLKELQDKKH